VPRSRAINDLAWQTIRLGSIDPKRQFPPLANRRFDPPRTTIKNPSERLARFQRKVALQIGADGWAAVAAASDPTDPEHVSALARCRVAANDLGKKWPWAWTSMIEMKKATAFGEPPPGMRETVSQSFSTPPGRDHQAPHRPVLCERDSSTRAHGAADWCNPGRVKSPRQDERARP
jgi:hypothetical protein